MSTAQCSKCGKHGYVMPLHGDRGGPPMCPICIGAWNAEHTRKRKWGRIIIKAMKCYLKEGGRWKDLDKFKFSTGGVFGTLNPILSGYDGDTMGVEVPDITSELLADLLQLVHPDRHAAEQADMAKRVTQELLELRPFVFPAPKPEPTPKYSPSEPNASTKRPTDVSNKRDKPYPCDLCSETTPAFYCDDCKAEEKRREREKVEAKNAKQRDHYARRRALCDWYVAPRVCQSCQEEFKPKRRDAKYCSPACRQRAHRKRDGHVSNSAPLDHEWLEAAIEAALEAEPDNAFTTAELCKRVWPGSVPFKKNRTAIIAAFKKLGKRRQTLDWNRSYGRGQPFVFYDCSSLMAYAMAREKADYAYSCWGWETEESLRANLSAGGKDHHRIAEGGAWRRHWLLRLAELEGTTKTPEYKRLKSEQDKVSASWGVSP